ncbi:hypothetical protein F383_23133 [Gossypium arboreum]|uniref:Uncharacterized protein n=1 Tax=Gossypium arboreum TaxID=29729 RepID=A0A0B0MM33_GOSAR|nr:hypothetical protein F383_23133 [Gossypium arboreum]
METGKVASKWNPSNGGLGFRRFCLAIMTQDHQPQDLRSIIVFWCSTR